MDAIGPRPQREPAFVGACAVLLGVCLWLALLYAPPLGFYSPDGALKWLQLKHLRFEGGLLQTSLRYIGRAYDPQLRSVPFGGTFFYWHHDQIELVWPPWFALMSWPFQWLPGARGLRVMPALSACASGLFSGLICAHLTAGRTRTAALVIAVLASPVIVYGMLAWEHAVSTGLACCGVWLWLRAARAAWWHAALAGASLALACAMRAELWVLCAALLTAALIMGGEQRRAGLVLGVWLGCATLPFALWTLLHSEHALPTNAAQNFSHASLTYLRKAGVSVLAVFTWGSRDALSWLGVGLCFASVLVAAVSSRAYAAGSGGLALARLHGALLGAYAVSAVFLVGRVLQWQEDNLHGLLESAPWLWLALIGVPGPRALPRTARLLQLGLAAYVLFYLLSISIFSWAGPNGGREWGPRFILPVYPLAAPLLVLAWQRNLEAPPWLRRGYQGAVLLCVGLSLVLHIQGLRTVHQAERTNAVLAQQLLKMPDNTLFVSMEWWTPTLLAAQFDRRPTFWVQDPAAWNEILGRAACDHRGDVWLAGMILPDENSLRALTVPQLELEQHAQNVLAGLTLRSLSVRPRTPELCSYLATHKVDYPARR